MTPLHTLAVCLLLFVCVALPFGIAAMHWHESAQGMTPDQTQAACDARAARCDAHWQAAQDAANSALDSFGVYRGPERRAYRAKRKQA